MHTFVDAQESPSPSLFPRLSAGYYSDIFLNNTDHKQVILLYEKYKGRHRMTRSNLNVSPATINCGKIPERDVIAVKHEVLFDPIPLSNSELVHHLVAIKHYLLQVP